MTGAGLPFISLFTGMGGLDLGLERAGFVPRLCVEQDQDCRGTLVANRPDWPLASTLDIHDMSAAEVVAAAGLQAGEALLVAGGPPCQPFSKAGWWNSGQSGRLDDARATTLGAFMDVVQAAQPAAFLLENVAGLTYRNLDEGAQYLRGRVDNLNARHHTQFALQVLQINARDYGAPQSRARVVFLGLHATRRLALPARTHGAGLQRPRTAWDAIGDLDAIDHGGDLAMRGKWSELLPTIPEGRNYLHHTARGDGVELFGWRTRYWSFLLKLAKALPSWTIAASPGSAAGPFHWRNRRLSTRELCRLQTIPDEIQVVGSASTARRQIGNAVPPVVGELLGWALRKALLGDEPPTALELVPRSRGTAPPPEPVQPVPARYRALVEPRVAHPGSGKGPGALRRRAVARAS